MDADPARAGRDAWVDRLLVEAGLPELATVLSTGNFTSAVAAVSAVTVLAFSYTRYGLVARPGSLPAAGHLAGFAGGATFLYLSCTGFVLLLTPTGSLPSPRWRWWARVQVAAAAVAFVTASLNPVPLYPEYPDIGNPLGVAALADGPLTAAFPAGALLVLAGLIAGAGSLLLRFRHAHGPARLQLRWLAAATLAAAAAFQPLRRRVQAAVDRRFNRRRHDAGQTIAAFSARLRAQVDLDTLTGELLGVVDQTMQPTRASLWLRPQAPPGPAAGSP